MQKALAELKSKICTFDKKVNVQNSKLDEVKKSTVVVLMAGGESSRFKEITDKNKSAFKLPNNDSMIEMTIKMYRDSGIKNFVALLYHQAGTVESLLGDGKGLDVSIRYSYDPGRPVGKGGAVRNALEKGIIEKDKYFIVHNPDDVILDYPGSFPDDILKGHLYGEREGILATAVVVEGTPYAYTGMRITNSIISEIEMYPIIPIPTHIGVSIFSPGIYNYFIDNFTYEKKSDFEKVLFPILSKEKKLYAVSIPTTSWLAVNNPRSYQELLVRLGIK